MVMKRHHELKLGLRVLASLWLGGICFAPGLTAQVGDGPQNAKAHDTVSPYGVSYHTGSFVYAVPVIEIGQGDFPDKLSVVLHYDSSNSTQKASGWSFSQAISVSGMVTSAVFSDYDLYDEPSAEPLYDLWEHGIYFGFGSISSVVEVRNADLSQNAFESATQNGHAYSFQPSSAYWYDQYGEFTFSLRDGSKITANGGMWGGTLKFEPDRSAVSSSGVLVSQHVVDANPGGTYPSRTLNNRGFLIVVEPISTSGSLRTQTFCTYNLALTAASATDNCVASNHKAVITYATGEYTDRPISILRPDGSLYQFEYTRIEAINGYTAVETGADLAWKSPKVRYKLSCVREPGSSVCAVTNTYDPCDGFSGQGFPNQGVPDRGWDGGRDRVIAQSFADGRSVTYSYPGQTTPCRDVAEVNETDALGTLKVNLAHQDAAPLYNVGYESRNYPMIVSVEDRIGRLTSYGWTGANPQAPFLKRADLLESIVRPAGNLEEKVFDARGNITQSIAHPKTGSPDFPLTLSAAFPAQCTQLKTCNKPSSITDAEGNVTEFEHSPDHGGVTKVTRPSDSNGVRPQTRYSYSQRYAWHKSGGSFVQAAAPIWLLDTETTCMTSTSDSSGNCLAGVGDKVTVNYEYEQGSSSKGSNLLLIGKTVTAEGQTLRTCFRYDVLGRQISTTLPMANLANCQ
jgi:hypothetical protein